MGDQPATTYGMKQDFDYDGFGFSDAFPVPRAYVVAYTMAHFRGPDGFLWFAPNGDEPNTIAWGYPQNVAEFDRRDEISGDPVAYRKAIDALCAALDALLAADAAYAALNSRQG